MTGTWDVAVIGAGIVGLSTARAILETDPRRKVVVLDKEAGVARHQTGHNSGVVHSGIYYRPGSLKARMCIAGSSSIVEYARTRNIAVQVTGKLIAATRQDELAGLEALHRRGLEHGLEVQMLGTSETRRRDEPHLAAIAALHVASTGIIDYVAVADSMAAEITALGGEIRTSTEVTRLSSRAGGRELATRHHTWRRSKRSGS